MSKFLFENMANSILAAPLDSTALAATLRAGDGKLFSLPLANEEFRAIIFNTLGIYEIIGVTSRAGDTLAVITRGLEGTLPLAWESGAFISQRVTKEIYGSFEAAGDHGSLGDRDDNNAHPISAITGLVSDLAQINLDIGIVSQAITTHEDDVTGNPHEVDADIDYDNTISGLAAVKVKTAIDELAAAGAGTHNATTGRDAADAHPLASITGLVTALAAKVDDADVGAVSGVAPLDANQKVPAVNLPSTGMDHLYTTQALMLADSANILEGELCLVTDDANPAKNGEYIALQNTPTLISHFYFKGDYVPEHTHAIYLLNAENSTLLTSADDLDTILTAGGYRWASTSVPAHAPESSHGMMYVDKDGGNYRQIAQTGITEQDLKLFGRRANLDVYTASWTEYLNGAHITDTGAHDSDKIAHDPTGTPLSSTNVESAINENANDLDTVSGNLSSHINNTTGNVHGVTIAQIGAAADTEFDNKLGGFDVSGKHVLYTGEIDDLVVNCRYALSKFNSDDPSQFPDNMGNYGHIHVEVTSNALRLRHIVYSFNNAPATATRTSSDAGATWTEWDTANSAENTTFNNSASGITASDVQAAIDKAIELSRRTITVKLADLTAESSDYDGITSGTIINLTSLTTFKLNINAGHEEGWNLTLFNKRGCTVTLHPEANVFLNRQQIDLVDICAEFKVVFLYADDANAIQAVYA